MNAHEHRKQFIKDNTIQTDGGASLAGIRDTRNCVVRATAIGYGIPYRIADQVARQAGRKEHYGFWIPRMVVQMQMNGYDNFQVIIPRKGLTLYSFLKEYKEGRYLIEIRHHAMAVINGKIYDAGLSKPLSRIESIHKVGSHRTQTLKDILQGKY